MRGARGTKGKDFLHRNLNEGDQKGVLKPRRCPIPLKKTKGEEKRGVFIKDGQQHTRGITRPEKSAQ